jgi:MFS family permease
MPTPTSAVAASPVRWLMWAVPAFLFLIGFFHRAAPGVIARDLMQTFGVTGGTVGLLAATYFYPYAALMVPGGLLIDAYGARRVVALGGGVMGVGALVMAGAPGTAALFGGRFLVGFGAATTFVGTLKIAAAWFPPAQFGLLAALTSTVGIAGALTSTLPLAALVGLVGWRGALASVGVATLAGAALCLVLVRDRPSGMPAPSGDADLRAVLGGAGRVLRNPRTWPPFLAFFCLYSVIGNQMLWIVPYLRDVHGLDLREAAWYATAPSLALLVAAPLTGLASDRWLARRKTPFAALTGVQCLLWFLFVATLGALPLSALYALLLAMGLAGAAFVLLWPMGREVNPPHLDGVAVAVVNFGGFLGAALTQGPIGAVLDARWAGALVDGARRYPLEAYRDAFAICATFTAAAALSSMLMRETHGRNIYTVLEADA